MSFWGGFHEKFAFTLTGVVRGVASGARNYGPKGSLNRFQPRTGQVTVGPTKPPPLPTPKPVPRTQQALPRVQTRASSAVPSAGIPQPRMGVSSTVL